MTRSYKLDMDKKIGFIGGGNIAKAIINGLITSGLFKPQHVIASTKTQKSASLLIDQYEIDATTDNEYVVKNADTIIIAVKPHLIDSVISPLTHLFLKNQLIISVAAGVTTQQLKDYFDEETDVFRVMPNTPAQVGAGMTCIFTDYPEGHPSLNYVKKLFSAAGEVAVLDESLVHASIATQGSSPAYMFMMLEAMGDAGVKLGLPRQAAYQMAAQTMLGSAQMYLESLKHPGELKDMVTSPKGTTIEAVATLEKEGFRNAIIEAMTACAIKSIKMSEPDK